MNTCKKNELNVIVVLDGRPGHEKQTLGLVSALSIRISVNSTVIDVSGRGILSQIKSYIELVFALPVTTVSMPNSADLVMGTGTRTHATILNIKRHFHIPGITCMTPGKHLRNIFDICFVPAHDGATNRSNYYSTYGALNSNTDKGKHSTDKGLILIGGVDEKSHVWNSGDIVGNIVKVVGKEKNIHWTITSSPRTPISTVTLLVEELQIFDNYSFFDFKETAKGWVEKQYERCKTVWVTADSISMLYEALSSGCSVNIFQMPWKKSSSKFKKNEDILIKEGLVQTFSQWDQGAVISPKVAQLNEAQRCADYILQTCWPEN